MQLFNLTIITPIGKIFDNKITHVAAPGEEGRFGVLAKHAPMLALLKPGRLEVNAENSSVVYEIGAGVLEVAGNDGVKVLCSTAVIAESKEPKQASH